MRNPPPESQRTVNAFSAVKLAAWALKQPDDRLVYFGHSTVSGRSDKCGIAKTDPDKCGIVQTDPDKCGCLMLQYMYEVLKPEIPDDFEMIHCGFREISVVDNNDRITVQYMMSHHLTILLTGADGNPAPMSEIVKLRTFGEVKPYLTRFIANHNTFIADCFN